VTNGEAEALTLSDELASADAEVAGGEATWAEKSAPIVTLSPAEILTGTQRIGTTTLKLGEIGVLLIGGTVRL
jgi:hypothetical protein